MSAMLFVLVVCVAGCYCWNRGDLEKYGPFQIVLRSSLIKCDHDRTLDLDVSGINVYFYDFQNNNTENFTINNAAKEIISLKSFDKSKKLVVFVGGFKSQINQENEDKIRSAYRKHPNSYLIMLDHSQYTHNRDGNIKSYERSVTYIHYIGKALAQMLAELHQGGVSPKNMHCVGHSLGAQILGQTGEQFLEITKKQLWRITALDPAGPCFANSKVDHQVRSGLAEYVEVYHCNSGALGSSSVLGDVDFFINKNGETQPNCRTPVIPDLIASSIAASCSHAVCIDVWAASVVHPDWFPATKCDSYGSFVNGECSGNTTIAGSWSPGTATGSYFFSTEGYDLTIIDKEEDKRKEGERKGTCRALSARHLFSSLVSFFFGDKNNNLMSYIAS